MVKRDTIILKCGCFGGQILDCLHGKLYAILQYPNSARHTLATGTLRFEDDGLGNDDVRRPNSFYVGSV